MAECLAMAEESALDRVARAKQMLDSQLLSETDLAELLTKDARRKQRAAEGWSPLQCSYLDTAVPFLINYASGHACRVWGHSIPAQACRHPAGAQPAFLANYSEKCRVR